MQAVKESAYTLLSPGGDSTWSNAQIEPFDLQPIWFSILSKQIKNRDEDTSWVISQPDEHVLGALPVLAFHSDNTSTPKIRPLSNYYSSVYEPILFCDESQRSEVINDLLEKLKSGFSWDLFHFGPLSKDGDSFSIIQQVAPKLGLLVKPYFWYENWVLDVANRSFSEYEASLPSQLKNTLRRKYKKLAAKFDYKFEIISDEQKMEQAVSQFEKVYSASWKKPEGIPEFIREFTLEASKLGWSRMGLLYADGDVCAAQLWYIKDGVASIFKLAHDERYKDYSPGSLLTYEMLKYAITVERVKKVDFLIGGDGYKKDWGFKMQERWGLAIFNKTFLGRALAFRHIVLPQMKSWVLATFTSKNARC